MLSSVGAMPSSKSQQHSVESSSFSRKSKCPGRQIESSQDKGNGVVIELCCSEQTIPDVGVPLDRSVRLRRKSEGSGILHMVSQSTGSDNRSIINCLGEHGSVCISSDLSHTESASAHEEISLSNNLDSHTMAKEKLVYQSSLACSGLSEKTSTESRSVGANTSRNCSPKSTITQSDCMATVN